MTKRSTVTLPNVSMTESTAIGEKLRAAMAAPLPRAPVVEAPPKARKKANPLYDPAAKPQVADPLGAVVHGNVTPDVVLAKIRHSDGHVSQISLKTAARPIDYLRDRSPNPISSEQFAAAEAFLADRQATARTASNTAAVIDHMQNSVPWTARDFELKASGDLMPYGTDVKVPKDKGDALLRAAWRCRRIAQKLPAFELSLCEDLVLRDYPVGAIAQRWGWSLDAASGFVRLALWRLVKAYEETDAEFRAWLIVERQTVEQEG